MFENMRLQDLPLLHCRVLRPASSTRPFIWEVEENGVRAVVKDFSRNGFLFRNLVGRFLVWREHKAYRKLRGLEGIPALYRVIAGLALVIQRIPGRNLENLEQEAKLSPVFFQALGDLIQRVHERGLAHCDLKRAPNTLVGEDERPYVIDWAAAIHREEMRFFPLDRIFHRFVRDDQMAVIKLKLRHIPEGVNAAERRQYAYQGHGERLIRQIRDRLRDLLQKAA